MDSRGLENPPIRHYLPYPYDRKSLRSLIIRNILKKLPLLTFCPCYPCRQLSEIKRQPGAKAVDATAPIAARDIDEVAVGEVIVEVNAGVGVE